MAGLESLLDELETAGGSDAGEAPVGDLLDAFEDRSLGALLTLFGAVAALPVVGAIPGVSVVTGALILLAIFQSLFGGKGGLWAPDRLRRQTVERATLEKAVEKSRPVARWIDRWLKPRLRPLASRGAVSVAAVPLAISFVPLAVVPFAVQAPATALTLLGLSLMGRDGVFALIGYGLALATIYLIWRFAL